MLYDVEQQRKPVKHGPLDTRLVRISRPEIWRILLLILEFLQGVSNKISICDTCGEGLNICNGHFGHIRLALPAFHIGYLKLTMNILQNICKV